MKMKKILACSLLALSISACSKVPAGYVGVKVNLLGNSKGVETEELGVGRYWIGINEELYLFPTFTQTYNWTLGSTEGSKNDESISFQSKQGMPCNVDIGISYSLEKDKINLLFQKYREGIGEITDKYLRNIVRDTIVSKASKMEVQEINENKTELLDAVENEVREQMKPLGIIIEKISYLGNIRFPESVVESINEKIKQTQKAQQRENEVREEKAKLEIAKLKAEQDRVRGMALKNNPALVEKKKLEVQQEWIQKWDGVLPTHVLGNQNLMMIKE